MLNFPLDWYPTLVGKNIIVQVWFLDLTQHFLVGILTSVQPACCTQLLILINNVLVIYYGYQYHNRPIYYSTLCQNTELGGAAN